MNVVDPARPSFESPAAQRTRRLARIVALAYLVFVIYGSLVPLDFRAVEMAEAVERFRHIPFLDLGIGSRADWVANLLLFIPLSYLFAASAPPSRRGALVVLTVIIAIGCAALSVAIEFTQIFFPPRTVSQNDIIAEALGAVLGLAAWWIWGQRSIAWLGSWQQARGAASLAEKLLWPYLLLLFGYNLLPLDLTISVVEIYHKWSEGRLNLIPFAATPLEPIRFLYEVVIDAILWVPVSLLLTLGGRFSAHKAVLWTLAAAALLEAMQLLVYSRYSDVTDLVAAVPGAFAGVWLAAWLRPRTPSSATTIIAHGSPIWLIASMITAWCLLLAGIFWYPFNISRDADLIRRGIDAFFQVPFVAYYFGSELRAITEVFHKIGFFIPLGAMLAWLRWALGRRGGLRALDVVLLMVLLAPALVIELGQVVLVDKHPGSTDLVLEWLGAIIGYVGFIQLARRWMEHAGPKPASGKPSQDRPYAPPVMAAAPLSPREAAKERTPSAYVQLQAAYAPYLRAQQVRTDEIPKPKPDELLRDWGRYLFVLLLMMVVLWWVTSSALAPYNLRELAEKFPPPLGVLGLLIASLVAFGPAGLIGRLLSEQPRFKPLMILAVFGHIALLYIAVRGAIPLESIDDIIGSVRDSATAEFERFLRFAGLFLFVGTAVAGGMAAWTALRSVHPHRIGRWFLLGVTGFLIGYWTIVERASTDNLVELIRGRGSLIGMFVLYLWLWATSFHAVLGVACLRRKLPSTTLLVATLVLLLFEYVLFWATLEPHVVKYQQVFSAMQFLLSPDRENYVVGNELLIRFVMMQFGLMLLMALAFYPTMHVRGFPSTTAGPGSPIGPGQDTAGRHLS